MSILAELFHEWYSPNAKRWEEGDEGVQEWVRNEELWTQAEQCLDAELFRELQMSVIELMDLETCRTFRAGFRLGSQLMQEISAASAPSRCPTPLL